MKNYWLAFILLSIFSSQVQATPTCAELQNRWSQKYIKDFDMNWDTTTFDCSGENSWLALALWDLEAQQHKLDISGSRPDFYDFILGQVNHFHTNKGCTVLANTIDHSVTLCRPFFTDSREDRASTLVHEARHTQEDDPKHVTCMGGKFNGDEGACDEYFHKGLWLGSGFNADVFFLEWTIKKDRRTELSASVIQSDINSMIPDRFNNISVRAIKKWRK